jgi:hypothetical protein
MKPVCHSRTMRIAVLAAGVLCAAGAARAQFSALHIGTTRPVLDETGSNTVWGSAMEPGCLVQIILAPAVGNPEAPFNPDATLNTNAVTIVGGETRIGMLTSPRFARPGLFGATLNNPIPASGTKLFVRVFNAANPYDATHYADSPVYTLGGSDLDAEIGATTNVLDMADDDGDGLNNRWERYYGSDVANADSDGDHVSDADEHRAGTDLVNQGSHLAFKKVRKQAAGGLTLSWQSVPGKKYRVEFADSLTEDDGEFYPLTGPLPATGTSSEFTIPDAYLDAANRQFRIVVIED